VPRRVHAVVLGGGPAGAAAAIELARSGREVALIERGCYERARVGETLPPEARRLLEELGAFARFERDAHVRSPGIISIWGTDAQTVNDFIFNPFGYGWHLDRARFDRSLAAEAEACGAALLVDARVVAAREGTLWCVRGQADGRSLDFEADWLVDATGRTALPFGPRRRRRVADRLAAVIGFGRAARAGDGRTVVEAVEAGWWYAATLPGGRAIATFITDPHLVGRDFCALFRSTLAATEVARAFLGEVDDEEISVVECSTWVRVPVAADGLVAVGDAASTYDPLSSLGICKALEGGTRAARAIAAGCIDEYEAWTASSFASYLRTRARYYALEARWPDASFWRLRRVSLRA